MARIWIVDTYEQMNEAILKDTDDLIVRVAPSRLVMAKDNLMVSIPNELLRPLAELLLARAAEVEGREGGADVAATES